MSHLVMKLALTLLPPSKKAWGTAMEREFAHLDDGQNEFALGCLSASLTANVTSGEGLLRLVFGLIAGVAACLFIYFLAVEQLPRPDLAGHFLIRAGFYVVMNVLPASVAALVLVGSILAMANAANAAHLAKLGTRITSLFLVIISVFF
jgi:hypothetical protein